MTVRRYVVLIVGLAALVVGGTLYFWPQPTSFGWTAYTPLSTDVYVPSIHDLAGPLGTALLIGTALTAGWIGYILGRRPARP